MINKTVEKATTKCKAPICSVCEDCTHKLKTNDMHILQTPDTFTLYKHKINNNFRLQKCERVDLFSCASIAIELPFQKVREKLNTSVERDANYTN